MAHTSSEAGYGRRKHLYSHHVPHFRPNPRIANNMQRIDGYEDEFKNFNLTDITPYFNRGDFVVSCWYPSSPLSRPSRMDNWREATVLAANADHTFSVQFFNGEIESVPKSCLSLNLKYVESPNPIVDHSPSDNAIEMKKSCDRIYSHTDHHLQSHQLGGIRVKLNNDAKHLDGWEQLLGKNRLRKVCEVFDAYALPAVSDGSRQI